MSEPNDTGAESEQSEQSKPDVDWKAEARKWEQRAKENKTKLDEAAPKLTEWESLVEASKTDQQRAQEQIQRQTAQLEQWRGTALRAQIQALAATDFADPSDAAGALTDTAKYVGSDGSIDEAAIKTDLGDLLKRKPHWRRDDGPRLPAANRAQGTSNSGLPVDTASGNAYMNAQLRQAAGRA